MIATTAVVMIATTAVVMIATTGTMLMIIVMDTTEERENTTKNLKLRTKN